MHEAGVDVHSGMFPCFFGGFRSRLLSQLASAAMSFGARRARLDDLVDEPARGRDERIGELLAELGDELRAQRRRIGGRRQLARDRGC